LETPSDCPDLKESWEYSINLSLFESAEVFAKDTMCMENVEGPTMVGEFVVSLWILT
jgi:hypothetical protein